MNNFLLRSYVETADGRSLGAKAASEGQLVVLGKHAEVIAS